MRDQKVDTIKKDLNIDPYSHLFEPNRDPREVHSGHYVHVTPTPLANPYIIAFSNEFAAELGLSEQEILCNDFAQVFSGDIMHLPTGNAEVDLEGGSISAPPSLLKPWATPYAVSFFWVRK